MHTQPLVCVLVYVKIICWSPFYYIRDHGLGLNIGDALRFTMGGWINKSGTPIYNCIPVSVMFIMINCYYLKTTYLWIVMPNVGTGDGRICKDILFIQISGHSDCLVDLDSHSFEFSLFSPNIDMHKMNN